MSRWLHARAAEGPRRALAMGTLSPTATARGVDRRESQHTGNLSAIEKPRCVVLDTRESEN